MKYPIAVEEYIAAMRAKFGPNERVEEVYRKVISAVNAAYQDGLAGARGYPMSAEAEIEAFIIATKRAPISQGLIPALIQWENRAYEQGREDARRAVLA